MSPKHAKPEPPDEHVPADPTPADPTPADPTPADPTPAGPTPAESAPAGPDPAEPTPGAPVPEDPAGGAPSAGAAAAPPAATLAEPTAAAPRRRRRRTQPPRVRSRWMWILLAVVGVGLLAWVLALTLRDEPTGTTAPSPTPTGPPQQDTILIQVRNDDEFGADNLVAGVGAGLPPAQLLVPSRLIVDVAGAGQQTLGQSARLLDRSASQDALGDLLALRIDGTLSLGRLALAGMVDFVGGITVTVDRPITEVDEATGVETVVVPEGRQTLDGSQAAAYALAWLPDEPEAARLARYSAVMTATIAGLPDDALRIEQMLTSLGGSARTTTSTTAVAEDLRDLRNAIVAGGQQVRVLPTNDVESGGLSLVRVDLAGADRVLRTLLPTAMLDAAQARPRVLVQNGVGTPGLGASARDRLVAANLVYINGGNAESFGQPTTQVLVPDGSAASLALGEQVAAALGVPETAVAVAAEGQNVADAVAVLGGDFQP